MGRDRAARNSNPSGRVAGGFVALPWSVLDCAAYVALSHVARALLIELARQYVRDNNGRLLASRAHLRKRGWRSADTISNAKKELLASGLVHQTVQGHRPNKADWFALTWFTLDPHPGYDAGAAATFQRGSYIHTTPAPAVRRKPPEPARKNAGLGPMAGTAMPPIGPVDGAGRAASGPMAGPIEACSTPAPVPHTGHHLETPSARRLPGGSKAQGQGVELERVRDCDLDPARFDPVSGECLALPAAVKHSKRAASAWVNAALGLAGKQVPAAGIDADIEEPAQSP